MLDKFKKHMAGLLQDGLMLCGIGAIAYGAWLIYVPAGWIVGGLMAAAVGFLWARGAG